MNRHITHVHDSHSAQEFPTVTTTPDRLRPAMTALQDLYRGVLTRAQALQDVRDAGRDVWTVSPELAAERADLAPVTVTITDYREVLTHRSPPAPPTHCCGRC